MIAWAKLLGSRLAAADCPKIDVQPASKRGRLIRVTDVTRILQSIETGDAQASAALLPLVYDELRRLAARELRGDPAGDSLQPTALVHEAYLRLVDQTTEPQWNHRGHFYAAAAEAMRRILVENARRKQRLKRGGDRKRVPLDEGCIASAERHPDLLALHVYELSLEASFRRHSPNGDPCMCF